MSNLHCAASNCSFNEAGSCYASNISVEGFQANITPETYCNTFRNVADFGFSNSVDSSNLTNTQNISCSASNCAYNNCGGCSASHVDINFSNNSCETFVMR